MKPKTAKLLMWILSAYSIPTLYLDFAFLLPFYGITLPLSSSPGEIDFSTLTTMVAIHIIASIPVVFGLPYLNRKRRQQAKSGNEAVAT